MEQEIDSRFIGPKLLSRKTFTDERGCLSELFKVQWLVDAGIDCEFVQDNYSNSQSGVLRGLHYQLRNPQAKLITVTRGAILDVGLDLRRDSPTFGQWFSLELTARNNLILYLPVGFAHGFSVLEGPADVLYKCSDVYIPDDQFGVHWADPQLAIDWKLSSPIVSPRDEALSRLGDIPKEHLP